MTFKKYWQKHVDEYLDAHLDEAAERIWNYQQKNIDRLNEELFALSAEATYYRRLTQEYEKLIEKSVQDSIKEFIFSEDDR